MISLIIHFFGSFFPYVTLAIFLTAMSYRIIIWLTKPMPVNWALHPTPKSKIGIGGAILKDVVTLGSHFKADKKLWVATIILHICFFLSVILHKFVNLWFADIYEPIFAFLGITGNVIVELAHYIGSILGILATSAVFYLLLRRIFLKKVREISSKEDYFSLIFLLICITLGTYVRVFTLVPTDELINYFLSLASFKPIQPPLHPAFLAHHIVAQLYLIYFPFSKCIHFIGLFINQWIVRREW